MKRLIALLVLFIMLLCFISCTNSNVDENLVGTWKHMTQYANDGTNMYFKFEKNGKYEWHNYYGETINGKYYVEGQTVNLDSGHSWTYSVDKFEVLYLDGGQSGHYKKQNDE